MYVHQTQRKLSVSPTARSRRRDTHGAKSKVRQECEAATISFGVLENTSLAIAIRWLHS